MFKICQVPKNLVKNVKDNITETQNFLICEKIEFYEKGIVKQPVNYNVSFNEFCNHIFQQKLSL